MQRMKHFATAVALSALAMSAAADVPPASPEFRAQITREYRDVCVEGIENQPALRASYSRNTVETYCTCRQRYRADVLAGALRKDERGMGVTDRASDYSHEKCAHILLKNLENE